MTGFEVRHRQPVDLLSDAFQRLAGFANIFPFWSSERQEFEAIIRTVAISDAGRQAQCAGWERDLQMNGFTDAQVAGGVHAYPAFAQVDSAAGYKGRGNKGRCLLKDPNSDVLLKRVTRKTTSDDMIHSFEFCVHRRALWDARHKDAMPELVMGHEY
jgi:hypothetical protein